MWIPFANRKEMLEEEYLQLIERLIGRGDLCPEDLPWRARVFHPAFYRLVLHTDRLRFPDRFYYDLQTLLYDIQENSMDSSDSRKKRPEPETIFRFFAYGENGPERLRECYEKQIEVPPPGGPMFCYESHPQLIPRAVGEGKLSLTDLSRGLRLSDPAFYLAALKRAQTPECLRLLRSDLEYLERTRQKPGLQSFAARLSDALFFTAPDPKDEQVREVRKMLKKLQQDSSPPEYGRWLSEEEDLQSWTETIESLLASGRAELTDLFFETRVLYPVFYLAALESADGDKGKNLAILRRDLVECGTTRTDANIAQMAKILTVFDEKEKTDFDLKSLHAEESGAWEILREQMIRLIGTNQLKMSDIAKEVRIDDSTFLIYAFRWAASGEYLMDALTALIESIDILKERNDYNQARLTEYLTMLDANINPPRRFEDDPRIQEFCARADDQYFVPMRKRDTENARENLKKRERELRESYADLHFISQDEIEADVDRLWGNISREPSEKDGCRFNPDGSYRHPFII